MIGGGTLLRGVRTSPADGHVAVVAQLLAADNTSMAAAVITRLVSLALGEEGVYEIVCRF